MRGCYCIVVCLLSTFVQAQQTIGIDKDSAIPAVTSPTSRVDEVNHAQGEQMPMLSASTAEHSVALVNPTAENGTLAGPTVEHIEMELVTRAIYQCMDHGRAVFADEENRGKYTQCVQIRAAHYQQAEGINQHSGRSAVNSSPCSGALVYQGGTYVFNDKEPCPIPDTVFKSRKPIEANPEYYTQPKS